MKLIRPLSDNVVVRRVPLREKVGLLYIPESAQEPPMQGVVVAAGPGVRGCDGRRIPMDLQPGDSVIFGRFAGADVEMDGEPLVVMREIEVIGRVRE